MKTIFIILFICLSCAHHKSPTDLQIDLYCQDLNVLYQRIAVISNNIVNVNTTRTADDGYYKKQVIKNCTKGICEIISDNRPPKKKYDPNHLDANKEGYVSYPNINLETEKSNQLKWQQAYVAVIKSSPVSKDFFLNDPRSKSCFEKYPALKEKLDYSSYLGRS